MLTSDLALIRGPAYFKLYKNWLDYPDEFADAFAKTWFKLLHRVLGPVSRYIGPEISEERFLWQDPLPKRNNELEQGDASG